MFTASIAGCLSNLVKSVNGLTSLEPSLYVTTKLLPSFVIVSILESLSITSCPRLDSKFLSSFVLENSILTFSLIELNSSSVTAAGSATATLSASATSEISYLLACDFNTNVNAPGSLAYEFPFAPLAIFPPSISVDVA